MADLPIVLVSNGGPHPPDRWAAVAASLISARIVIDECAITPEAAEARKAKRRFNVAVAEALEPAFLAVADAEKNAVQGNSKIKRHDQFNVEKYVAEGVKTVSACAIGTPFEAAFQIAAARQLIQNILSQNFIDAANIARSWSLDAKGL